jgi:hypothetical protein
MNSLTFQITGPNFRKIHYVQLSHSRFTSRHPASKLEARRTLSSQARFKQPHRILQIAMGRENDHLHGFLAGTKRFGVPDRTYDEPGRGYRGRQVPSRRGPGRPGTQIRYVYDFGDYRLSNPQKSVVRVIRRDVAPGYGGFRLPAACSKHRWNAAVDCPSHCPSPYQVGRSELTGLLRYFYFLHRQIAFSGA